MHLDKILTKEYLEENLINKNISIMQLALIADCCKHMIIKYCKKHEIYEKVKKISKISNNKSKDLSKEVFGDLKVLCLSTNDVFGKTRWKCQCKCGREKIVNAASLIRGLTETCGFCAERHNFKGYQEISGVYWRKLIDSAEKRCYEFNITPQYVWEIYLSQNKKCNLSGVDIVFYKNQDKGSLQTASIDRIDSKLPYIENNIQILHKRVQKIKDVVPNDELIYWCKLIFENKKELADSLFFDVSKIGYYDK